VWKPHHASAAVTARSVSIFPKYHAEESSVAGNFSNSSLMNMPTHTKEAPTGARPRHHFQNRARPLPPLTHGLPSFPRALISANKPANAVGAAHSRRKTTRRMKRRKK
jgi:hypothetical protein